MKVSRLFLPLIFGTLMALVFLFGAGWQVADTAHAATPAQTDFQVALRYVATTGSDTTDCTDSANPCATIQYAVDQAGAGDEVRVAGGTYTGVNNYGGLSQMVYITKTITVRGGYTVTNWMDPDPNLYPTTLDAQGQGRVIYISGLVSPTVEGLQITGGNAIGLGGKSPKGGSIGGGGIYVITSTAKIVNNEIISNTAGSGGGISVWESDSWIYSNTIVNNNGGGLALVSSTSIVQGNTISGNTSLSHGGGLLAGYSQLSIIANNLTNNQADRGGGIYISSNSDGTSIIGNNISSNIGEDGGGGIYVDQSNVTITANTINSNTISSTGFVEHGGGIFISANAYTITQNTISYNMNNSDYTGVGGGVYVGYNSNGLFSENLVLGNEAFQNGGGVYIESGGIISANHFISNTSDEYGGGLYIGSASYIFGNHFEANFSHFGGGMSNAGSNTIENNVFTNNTAYLGGGLAVTAGENFIINNLIIQNEATDSGAGLLLFESTGHLIHNTLAQNVGGNGGLTIGGGFPFASAYITDTIIVSHTVGIFVGGSFSQDSASLEATLWSNETNWAGPGVITTGTINFYGDPAFIDPANSDYHISPNSIAIDSGINANITTDIDGDMRPVGAGFDIGADEFPFVIRYVATTGSDTTDCTDSANPCATIQYAVDQAGAGNEVRVASGVYTGVNNHGGLSQMVYISKTMTVRGGYTVINWIESDPVANPTTLNPGGLGRGFFVGNVQDVIIEGFQVLDGEASNLSFPNGGGILILNSEPVYIHLCTIEGSSANSGGGIGIYTSTVILSGNIISGNNVMERGGGMDGLNNIITMTQNTIEGNFSSSQGGGIKLDYSNNYLSENKIVNNTSNSYGGGGSFIFSQDNYFVDNLISHNTASSSGGGLSIGFTSGQDVIARNIITGNVALADSGGGVYLVESPLMFMNNIVSNNSADQYGGGLFSLFSYPADIDIANNHFVKNTGGDGGAIYIHTGIGIIRDNVVLGNTGWDFGGGITLRSSSFDVMNNVIAQNHLTQENEWVSGSGVYLYNSTGNFFHNTLAQNTGGTGSGVYLSESTFEFLNTILISHTVGISVSANSTANLEATLWGNDTDWAGNGAITTGTINLYGDPSFVDPVNGDYHLNPNSIAIDAGIDAGISTDIDGEARPHGAGFDLGADEFSTVIRYVATTGTNNSDCTDSANPCATIQYAVDQAGVGDEVRVASGVYTGVNNHGGLSQMVYITKTITVRGGYTVTNWIESDPNVNPTTLDAEGQGRVMYITGMISPTIEGVYITGGSASLGGGLYIFEARASLNKCMIVNNLASHSGGGVYLEKSSSILQNNVILSNTAIYGGGIHSHLGAPFLENNQIANNHAVFHGGGIQLMDSPAHLVNNQITENRVEDDPSLPTLIWGGGVFIYDTSGAMLENNLIARNVATSTNQTQEGHGAGISVVMGDHILLINNQVVNNFSDTAGGGIYIRDSDHVFIYGNQILGNQATWGVGGGILISDSSPITVSNNIIANNQALEGSGIEVYTENGYFSHNTIANNHNPYPVGSEEGIWLSGSATFSNTIFISHTVGIHVPIGSSAHFEATLWGNDTNWTGYGTITTGTINLYGDPNFIDPANGDYHLSPNSIAIDAGIDAGVTTDIDGDTRPFGAGFDIGADEFVISLMGSVTLPGRADHSGAVVAAWVGESVVATTTTDSGGAYALSMPNGVYTISIEMPLYLDAVKTNVFISNTSPTFLSPVTLKGGDTNDSDKINIFDLSLIGSHYDLTCADPGWDPRADVNGDCVVNLLDLTLSAANFGKTSPVVWE